MDGECLVVEASIVDCASEFPDPCTVGVWEPSTGECSSQPLEEGASCDDGDACTQDGVCLEGICQGGAIGCDDGNLCTDNLCDFATGGCSFPPVDGPCCVVNADCDDGLACTNDVCDVGTGACSSEPIAGCCDEDSDCADDGNACTLEACGDASSAKALYLRCARGYEKHFGPEYEWAREARAAAGECG